MLSTGNGGRRSFVKFITGRNSDVSQWLTSRAAPLDHAPGLVMIALFAAVWSGVLVSIGMIAVVYFRK